MKENAEKARALDADEIEKQMRETSGADVPAAVPDVDGADWTG